MYLEYCINIYKKLLYISGFSFLALCLLLRVVYFSYFPKETKVLVTDTDDAVTVTVSGAVLYPGTYKLNARNTVREALAVAGGTLDNAVLDDLPLDKTLADRQNIHIEKSDYDKELININKATAEELDTLPGIGPAIAGRIIDYRKLYGEFTDIEQILEVDGIGEEIYRKLKNKITF